MRMGTGAAHEVSRSDFNFRSAFSRSLAEPAHSTALNGIAITPIAIHHKIRIARCSGNVRRGLHMKTTLNIDNTSWPNSSARPHGKAAPCRKWSNRRYACCSVTTKAGERSPLPKFHSGGAVVDIADAMPYTRHGRPLVLAVDTNVLVYAADADSQFHDRCRDWLEPNDRAQTLGTPRGQYSMSFSV